MAEKTSSSKKILLVGSSGGHLAQLYMLKPIWKKHERVWVSFNKDDANNILKNEKLHYCYFPTNRNIKNLIKNTFLAIKVLHKEKPDIIISSGAGIAIPFFWLGKLHRTKNIYIEVYDRIDATTMTGKICHPVSDLFIVQWPEMTKVYKKAINLGSIF